MTSAERATAQRDLERCVAGLLKKGWTLERLETCDERFEDYRAVITVTIAGYGGRRKGGHVKRLLPLALLLCGCAVATVTARAMVPTLYVENLTDDQLAVYVEGRSLARVPPLGTACVKLVGLPPRQVVLGFRALANGLKRTMPEDYATGAGWAITISSATHDGGFFAHPAPRCKGN